MRQVVLGRKLSGEAVVDLCAPCHLLWFDAFESVQLTPGGTLALFEAIRDGAAVDRRPVPNRLGCPRCGAALAPTQDLQRTTRFTYHRCPRGHGRLTPFVQFLREKDFIRPLPPADIARLAAQVAVIRCSGCGAPVDLARDTACGHCGSPIAVLDPDAVARTVGALKSAEAKRATVDIDALFDGLADAQSRQRELDRVAGRPPIGARVAVDLLDLGFDLLKAAMSR
jgi:DNA-directed RNA polymerase subunit RPC12/RpoP